MVEEIILPSIVLPNSPGSAPGGLGRPTGLRSTAPHRFDHFLPRRDGIEMTWALSSKWPLLNEAGETIGMFGISKDVTAIKESVGKQETGN